MAPSSSNIPIELLFMIAAYISQSSSRSIHGSYLGEEVCTLSALVKTCKYFRSVFEPLLYQSIPMDVIRPEKDAFPLLFRTLLNRPDLRVHIDELYIEETGIYDLPEFYTEAELEQTRNEIKSLISSTNEPSMSSVKQQEEILGMLLIAPGDILSILFASRLLPNLKHLSLTLTQRRIDSLLPLFHLPASLSSLSVKWVGYDYNNYPQPEQVLDPEDILHQLLSGALGAQENLQSLYFEQHYEVTEPRCMDLLKLKSTLESSIGPTISSLTLIVVQDNPGDWRTPQQLEPDLKDDKPLGSMKEFKNLKKLETNIEILYGPPRFDDDGNLIYDLEDLLPPQLEEFRTWTMTCREYSHVDWIWEEDDIEEMLENFLNAEGAKRKEGQPTFRPRKAIHGDPRIIDIIPFFATF
ncbi:hypothetical protein AJ79_05143 [Helicocarpus griseus UAMH5409]|uniref:F-box domain-containing protein n=1 Tax=Helicocarpus griseus UAMH5409 TaxID=1447875 RepID=A0A2B7XQS3_9EURO|nr:hypothetical protein AJ79_05143 [Helicocarpus griseus UAMH5409]